MQFLFEHKHRNC